MLRVLIVDDHAGMHVALTWLLNGPADLDLMGGGDEGWAAWR